MDYSDDIKGKDNKKWCEKYAQLKEKYKKTVQFIQDTYNEESDDDDKTLAKFGLWNVGNKHELDIIIIFLI